MSDEKDIKEYAGGWITERKGTEVPGFLKATYIAFSIGTVAYLIFYLYGETSHSDRGALVQEFNKVTQTSEGFMYTVAALAAVFLVLMIVFAFRKMHEEE